MTDASVTVTLPDGSHKQTSAGTSIGDFVRDSIGTGLAKAAVLAKANGQLVDLSRTLDRDTQLEVFTTKTAEGLDTARHDAAHIVADAVQRLFPGTQVTIGPTIENGFYYDFDRGQPFSEDDLARIEAEANKIVAADLPFKRTEVSPDEAIRMFTAKGEAFKVEIIQDIVAKGAKVLTLYSHGEWVDFCEGPHGPSTGRVGVIKLLSSSAAYWRGDHRNKTLQRIYGTAFFDKKALDAWLKQREEAEKRDHRRLGKELDLFHFHPLSPGAPFWTPKGTAMYTVLSAYMRQLALANGYVEIKTPLLYNKGLWERSGHWGKYKENMFLVEDSEAKAAGDPDPHHFSLKPMNCPSHHLYYGFRKQSYRDLPLRLHTQDVLHRNEAAGSLGGLTRVRQFAQDDAHIYCREDQISEEVKRFVQLLDRVYNAFGLKYSAKFATRPPQRIGDDAMWDRAEASLKAALDALDLAFELKPGDGAFYGPKIDFDVSDSIGRKWQLGTIQLDYAAPERFDLTYVGEDGKDHRPVVLHRAIYGSFERFIAILIEHYAGAFPAWLAPVQVAIVTVTDRVNAHAQTVADRLAAGGIRVAFDDSNATMNAKIREASVQKVPYTVVLGDKEIAADQVTVRTFGADQRKMETLAFDAFAQRLAVESRFPMIRIYFDYISPYSYLAWVKLAEIAARHRRAVEPVPILFAAILDARGARGPAEEPARRAYLIKDLLRRAHDFGVPLELPPAHPFNPLLPLRLTSLPMPADIRHALVDHLFAATWAGGGGITDRKLVGRIAHEVGLPDGALADAETPENKARLKAATDEAIAAGAFGVPTMIADGEMFFGSDSLPHLDRFLAGGDPVDQDIVERWMRLPAASQRPQATRT